MIAQVLAILQSWLLILTPSVPAHVYIWSCQKYMLPGPGCQPNEPFFD